MQPTPAPAEPGTAAPRLFTLGINAAFHDCAAALVLDGQLIAAAEEERFTRIRHGKRRLPFMAWELPYHAIDFCLKDAGITLANVSHVTYSYDPQLFIGDRLPDQHLTLPLQPADFGPGVWESPWDPLFAAHVLNAPRQLREGVPHHLQRRFALPDQDVPPYRWHFVAHHLCHQASAFLAAPFSRCAVMTLDGRGEQASTSYGRYRDSRYEALGEVRLPHSLGLLYEQVMAHLGFLPSSDEGQLMAMAALGQPRFEALLREHVVVGAEGHYTLKPLDLARAVGPPRQPGSRLEPAHFDMAASLQAVLEETVLQLATWLRERTGEHDLAMAGALTRNCRMNARLSDAGIFKRVWAQPATGDAGTALGAALWTDARERRGLEDDDASQTSAEASDATSGAVFTLAPRRWQMAHPYLGPEFEDDEVEALLQWAQARYRRTDDAAARTAELLARHKVVGWFQGRMEFGPSALGARSILASPVDAAMRARLNALKDGEEFRPVAAAVNAEDMAAWFEPAGGDDGQSPFMLFAHQVLAAQRHRIPSALQADGTARVQAVHADTNPLFHELLQQVGRTTGVPVLVNTAFSVRGEPIVATPRSALEAFSSTPLDALVIGGFILEKPPS